VGLAAATQGTAHPAVQHTGHFGSDTRVRHIVGLDGTRRGVALTDRVEVGMQLTFCQRHVAAARADLMRICAEIREELEPAEVPQGQASAQAAHAAFADSVAGNAPAHGIRGAIYVSCSGRGGPYFGGPSAELQWVRHALGDVPLVGFFAGGEIAHQHLYGYTGVLTVFAGGD
jgi:small ligand-binding sensory domain FIST